MKQETKELIKWIKDKLHKWAEKTPYDEYENKNWKMALQFLDSLPEIENHLTKGGYIQDRNGTPCCEGDKIKLVDKKVQGVLMWSGSQFFIRAVENDWNIHGPVDWYLANRSEIEKITSSES